MRFRLVSLFSNIWAIEPAELFDEKWSEEDAMMIDGTDTTVPFAVINPSICPSVEGVRYFYTLTECSKDALFPPCSNFIGSGVVKYAAVDGKEYYSNDFAVSSAVELQKVLEAFFTEGGAVNPFIKARLTLSGVDYCLQNFYSFCDGKRTAKAALKDDVAKVMFAEDSAVYARG